MVLSNKYSIYVYSICFRTPTHERAEGPPQSRGAETQHRAELGRKFRLFLHRRKRKSLVAEWIVRAHGFFRVPPASALQIEAIGEAGL